jgi:hypothetical protein
MRWLGNLTLGHVLCCVMHANAWADKRVALVIGNGAYANAPKLSKPLHDAEDVAAALKHMNFEVIRGIDLGHSGKQDAVIGHPLCRRCAIRRRRHLLLQRPRHPVQWRGNELAHCNDDADSGEFNTLIS